VRKWEQPLLVSIKSPKGQKMGSKICFPFFASLLKWERQLGLFFLCDHYVFWSAIQRDKDREQEKRERQRATRQHRGKIII